MTSPTTPEEVAKRLTKAQIRAIVAMTDRWQRPGRKTFSHEAAFALSWTRNGCLVDRARMGATAATAHDEFRLLPLGLSVKALLLEQGNGGGDE